MNAFVVSLQFFAFIFLELTILFLGVSTLIGLIFEYASDDDIRRRLSAKGLLGNFLGATLSFVLASPLLNPITMAMFWALMGWKACLTYGAVTFVIAMVGGRLLESFGLAKDVKNVRVSGGHWALERLSSD